MKTKNEKKVFIEKLNSDIPYYKFRELFEDFLNPYKFDRYFYYKWYGIYCESFRNRDTSQEPSDD